MKSKKRVERVFQSAVLIGAALGNRQQPLRTSHQGASGWTRLVKQGSYEGTRDRPHITDCLLLTNALVSSAAVYHRLRQSKHTGVRRDSDPFN